ncbi:MAG: amidohydrolase family protein [Planctomycetia bacterium]|nr:amidohydrolase family protein [Planctomycetia bacterium]
MSSPARLAFGYCVTLALALPAGAQAPDDIRELKLRDWEPRSMLVARARVLEKPMFPVIDIHNHLGGGKQFLTEERVNRYLTEMDEAGVRTVVNLDGGFGDRLKETVAALDRAYPGRFLTFALLNFDGLDEPDWGVREAKRLEESFQAGARGLKIHKSLGLSYRYTDGTLMPIDDPKLDPVWETCAKHKKPVVIHVSDPAAFFTPLDRFNERWHELNANPGWLFYGPKFPKREEILAQLHRAIEKHPHTTFVNTHFGNNAEDLESVAKNLDKYPNMYVDIDARISELGRQPYATRRFFLKYADRIMFGTDTTPRREAFRIYYRFLETDDEYFDCSASHHRQGFWNIYGIYLPRDVLEKVYYRNAARLFGLDVAEAPAAAKVLRVRPTDDFELSGDGSAAVWTQTDWEALSPRGDGLPYDARFKLLYSKTGLYVLFHGTDRKLTAAFTKDFEELWKEDVCELFVWPDESQPAYFEYEISPLAAELAIQVANADGKLLRWRPYHDDDASRKTRRATAAAGGEKSPGASVTGWTAEAFIPYELLRPLGNAVPSPGTRWRANFYRVDYDDGRATGWDWSRVGRSFHDYRNFGTLVFEP